MAKSLAIGLLLVSCFTLILLQSGCSSTRENVGENDSREMAKAEKNYSDYCAGCHGDKMDMFVDRRWKHGNSKDSLFHAIKVGYPDEGMPGFDSAFTDQEILQLSEYILKGIQNVKNYDFKAVPKSSVYTSGSVTVTVDTVVSGLPVPWGLAFLPDGNFLVTERGGRLYRVGPDNTRMPVEGTPEVLAAGQGGMLDVALHPDFSSNQMIYLSYSKPQTEGNTQRATTAVMRARLSGNSLINQEIIFEALPYHTTKHHYGSRLQFDKSGFLYISVGDRGNEKVFPQDLSTAPGKVHRIHDDGRIPADNPFVNRPGAIGSIYSYGHRNIQGMTMHPETGEIWTNEHGPRGGDEVNISEKGKNYGWPVISYGINYNGTVLTTKTAEPGMEQPLVYWLPSIGPSGMAFVSGDRYKDWKGHALVGSLRFNYVDLCRVNGNKIVSKEPVLKNIGRVRDVRMGPDGYLYVSIENPGAVLRLVPRN